MEGGRRTSKAEIDTSAPFRSVKEAVMLFGERVLAGEKPKEDKRHEHEQIPVASELEETKQSLLKAREESIQMSRFLSSLQQQLHQTKRELEHLKTCGSPDEEDLKYVESSEEMSGRVLKKCVSFSTQPPLAHMVVPPGDELQREPSLKKKKKKKQLVPFIAGIFSKKRGSAGAALT